MKMDLNSTMSKKAGAATVLAASLLTCAAADAGQAKFLYTLDLGSGTVKSYTIGLSNGSLTLLPPVTSTRDTPFSLAASPDGKFIYGTNRDSDVLTFAADSAGRLPFNGGAPSDPNSVPTFSVGLGVWQTIVHPNGVLAYALSPVSNVSPLLVDQATGALGTNSGASAVQAGVGPRGVIDPTGKFLYTANGGVGFISDPPHTDNISAFNIDPVSGALSPVTGSPFLLPQFSGPGSITVSANGKLIAITDVGDAQHTNLRDIRTYRIGNNGALTLAGSPISTGSNTAGGVQFDPSGKFLFALSGPASGTGVEHVVAYSVDLTTGALGAKVSDVALAANESPVLTAMDPSGKFLFVVIHRETSRSLANFDTFVAAYTVSPTGTLTQSVRTMVEHDANGGHTFLTDMVLGQRTP
jgi:6-phosphogluconolactonase (cycloisomerase 2 family)